VLGPEADLLASADAVARRDLVCPVYGYGRGV